MRRPPAFVLLLLLFAASCPAAAAMTPSDPTKVVESWSQAINASDDETAADLFAPDARRDPGRPPHDARRASAEALAFNSSLPCGGKIVKTSIDGQRGDGDVQLTRRPGHMCDGTGEAAVAVFRITDGKITLWHQLPPVSSG